MDAIIGTGNISKRQYGIVAERDVFVPMSDGVNINVDVFRPDGDGKFPALLSMSPYNKEVQSDRIWPGSSSAIHVRGVINTLIEAGNTDFFVRRGYVHIIGSARGTGKSGGAFSFIGAREIRDIYEIVEWAAAQPWCNGKVGMLGISYFAANQQPAAALQPPHLKAIFPLFAPTDFYRDVWYHGGILNAAWINAIASLRALDLNAEDIAAREELGDDAFKEAVARALADRDICANPELADALTNPDGLGNGVRVDMVLHPTDCPYWRERAVVDYDAITIPTYVGAAWYTYYMHLPGAFRSWANLKVPKKMAIGPPIPFDRPFYQYHWEILRWYDHWLKGIDTGIMDEPAVKIWVMGANEWKFADDWPVPGTRWIPFSLHHNGILSEIEPWPDALSDSFNYSPSKRGSLKYFSPPLVENTEVVGPIALNLYASARTTDVNFFISLWDVDPEGNEAFLSRGWLKGSHREVDPERSKPWQPFHPHTNPQPLVPGQVYQFAIEVMPTANLFKRGHRICLKISCADDEQPKTPREVFHLGHLWSQTPTTVTIYHDADRPSCLLLPITGGNIIGTYLSGGELSLEKEAAERLHEAGY
jgi:predicted acyl esterase